MPDDPKLAEDEKRDAGREQSAEAKTINTIMATYEGRWFMWNLLGFCQPMHARMQGADDSALVMAWRDGKAAAGLHLMAQIDAHAPEMYVRMLKDHQTRLERATEREKAKTAEPDAEAGVPRFETALERMAETQAKVAAEREQAAAAKGRK